MPYLLLALALLVGGFGLYRFILAANVRQVMALFLAVIILSIAAALFLLAITGRLPAALALLVALWPICTGLWMRYKRMARASAGTAPSGGPMTRDEALQILGLPADADEATIRAAHKTLIKKLHPDQDGSAWLAARINQARDVLLRE